MEKIADCENPKTGEMAVLHYDAEKSAFFISAGIQTMELPDAVMLLMSMAALNQYNLLKPAAMKTIADAITSAGNEMVDIKRKVQ